MATISFLDDDDLVWASGGAIEEPSDDKKRTGWTGSTSDYAYSVWVNYFWNYATTRMNTIAEKVNTLLQQGIATYNSIYSYPVGATCEYNGNLFIAKTATANVTPPSDDSSNDSWDLIIRNNYFTEQMALKANLASPALTGTPTTPTPTGSNTSQIANVEYVTQQLDLRITGASEIDLSSLSTSYAYPILLAKDGLTTNCVISRDAGYGVSTQGFMRLSIEGIGEGLSKIYPAFINVIHLVDSVSASSVTTFVKKIVCEEQNCIIAVWLRGGVKYKIHQYNVETKPQIVTSTTTLDNNWVVSLETFDSNLPQGAWEATNQGSWQIDSTSVSDTGSIATLGTIVYAAGTEAPTGSLICNGQTVSRTTYASLFNYLGTRYGAGDGITTFALPDLRGVVIRGIDLGRGYDCGEYTTAPSSYGSSSRSSTDGVGSYQSDAIKNITGMVSGGFENSGYMSASGCFSVSGSSYYGLNSGDRDNVALYFYASNSVDTTDNSTGENIVKNVALLPCIYYL